MEDWGTCVKSLAVSSRESWAYRLSENSSSYWQSCGAQVSSYVVVRSGSSSAFQLIVLTPTKKIMDGA